MTDNTQPEAGSTHIIRYALEMGLLWIGRDKVREALDALDTLEAQLASIGAGGVSGPLMGQSFDAADMATASAQGFLDGVASLAASAGSEPVAGGAIAEVVMTVRPPNASPAWLPHKIIYASLQWLDSVPVGTKLYTHPSPPEGMVGGWMPIESAPERERVLLWSDIKRGDPTLDIWGRYKVYNHPQFTHWSRWAPLPPTSSADSRKGE